MFLGFSKNFQEVIAFYMANIKITNSKRKRAINKLRPNDQMKGLDLSIDDFILEMEARGMTDSSHVVEYSQRITHTREIRRYTKIAVARLLGTTHTAINDEESGKKKKISLSFLLGFSLLYQVSPLFLVGETNDESCYDFHGPTMPMVLLDKRILTTVWLTLVNLYKKDDNHPNVNSMLLQIILQLCESPFWVSRAIRHTLLDSPVLKILIQNPLDFTNTAEQSGKIWEAQFLELGVDCRKKTEFDKYQESLYQFGLKDFQTLNLFAHISGAEPQLKEGVSLFLKYGGFLDEKN